MKNKLFIISIIGYCCLFAQDSFGKNKPDKGYFPCMTWGATYTESWKELTGTCGKVPDIIINMDKTMSVDLGECEKRSVNKCTTIGTNCVLQVGNGLTLVRTFKTELSVDGKSGTSFEIVDWSYNGTFFCHSIYSTILKRK